MNDPSLYEKYERELAQGNTFLTPEAPEYSQPPLTNYGKRGKSDDDSECARCGAEVDPDDKFCSACGAQLD